MRPQQGAQGVRGEARHVAVQHDDVAARGRKHVACCAHCVAGPERLVLHGNLDAIEGRRAVRRGDNDDARDPGVARGLDDPVDHPPPKQRVQVLRHRTSHAGAEATGHHDCCELVRHVR